MNPNRDSESNPASLSGSNPSSKFPNSITGLTAALEACLTLDQLQTTIVLFARENGFAHASYRLPYGVSSVGIRPIYLRSFPAEWEQRHKNSGCAAFDPLTDHTLKELIPTDWKTLQKNDPKIAQAFREADMVGIGSQGISVTVRGPRGEVAIISFTSDLSDPEWQVLLEELLSHILLAGHLLHHRVMRLLTQNGPLFVPKLSRREKDCLRYCAQGLRDKETARTLQISDAVVRGYLDSARRKLRAATRSSAVVAALQLGIIEAVRSEYC